MHADVARLRAGAFRAALLIFALLAILPVGMTRAVADQLGALIESGGNAAALKNPRLRFIIGLERPVTFNVFTLSNPYRVVVDLPDVKFTLPPAPRGGSAGVIKSFRGGLLGADHARIIIEATGPVLVEGAKIEKGGKGSASLLAIELAPTDAQTFLVGQTRREAWAANTKVASGKPGPVGKPQARAVQKAHPVIIIDPGHGGHDSGAQKHGTVEKEVVLEFGKRLRDMLKATGKYEVHMTREEDVFIPLEERREFAVKKNASLFLAIHADYVGSNAANVRGATVYTLSEGVAATLARSRRRFSREDVTGSLKVEAVKAGQSDPDVVRTILRDLEERETQTNKGRTDNFARNVIGRMGQATQLKATPHREASFVVLKTAKVPSVLIELAYVSNKDDAANLRSAEWQKKVSTQIGNAVDAYFNSIDRLPL